MMQTLRTLIVDDEPLAIERLQILAGQQDGVSLVGTASDGASALRMVDALAPDLVLCDIAMPDLNGLAVAAALDKLDNSSPLSINMPSPPSTSRRSTIC